MRYRSLRMENENQLERLARMKSGEQFPAMQEGDGSQHAGAGDRSRTQWSAKCFGCGISTEPAGNPCPGAKWPSRSTVIMTNGA